MKKTLIAFLLVMAGAAFADPAATNIVIKQRWPWSPVVDIDYWFESTESADVSLRATYDGCPAGGVDLTAGITEGGLCAVPGQNHVVWSPTKAGIGSGKFSNFSVTVTVVGTFSERKYMVIDLKLGTVEYYAGTAEQVELFNTNLYKTRYMVFRRIPAGTYQLGYTPEQLTILGGTTSQKKGAAKRVYTLSTDYYMGIHHLSQGQAGNIWNGYGDGNNKVGPHTSIPYYDVRGKMTNEANRCLWPRDGHHVVNSSYVGKIRTRVGTNLPATCVIDLPTEAQWEAAVRCGQYATFLSTGGTTKEDTAALQAEECPYRGEGAVGGKNPNLWGLYDTLGHIYEPVLNVCELDLADTVGAADFDKTLQDSTKYTDQFYDHTQKVDPIGLTCTDMTKVFMVTCNVGWSWGTSVVGLPTQRRCYRQFYENGKGAVVYNSGGFRLCVHLKKLVPDEAANL